MANSFYNPKNQAGKNLVPVNFPKNKTDAADTDFIDISWIDTQDDLKITDKKKVVSSEALSKVITAKDKIINKIKERFADIESKQKSLKEEISKSKEEVTKNINDLKDQISTNTELTGTIIKQLSSHITNKDQHFSKDDREKFNKLLEGYNGDYTLEDLKDIKSNIELLQEVSATDNKKGVVSKGIYDFVLSKIHNNTAIRKTEIIAINENGEATLTLDKDINKVSFVSFIIDNKEFIPERELINNKSIKFIFFNGSANKPNDWQDQTNVTVEYIYIDN